MKKRAKHWMRRAGMPIARTVQVVAEHADNVGRAGYADKGGNAHYHETAFDAEPEGIPHAFVFSCTIIKSALTGWKPCPMPRATQKRKFMRSLLQCSWPQWRHRRKGLQNGLIP